MKHEYGTSIWSTKKKRLMWIILNLYGKKMKPILDWDWHRSRKKLLVSLVYVIMISFVSSKIIIIIIIKKATPKERKKTKHLEQFVTCFT